MLQPPALRGQAPDLPTVRLARLAVVEGVGVPAIVTDCRRLRFRRPISKRVPAATVGRSPWDEAQHWKVRSPQVKPSVTAKGPRFPKPMYRDGRSSLRAATGRPRAAHDHQQRPTMAPTVQLVGEVEGAPVPHPRTRSIPALLTAQGGQGHQAEGTTRAQHPRAASTATNASKRQFAWSATQRTFGARRGRGKSCGARRRCFCLP